MKKFITLTREEVLVENFTSHDSFVTVHYKGKGYRRNFDVFGTKLFPMDITTKEYLKDILNIDVDIVKKRKNASKKNVGTSNSIKIGHVVKLKDCSNKELLTVKIVGVHQNKTYKRMGGSYYGNQTDVSYVGNGVGEKNGVYNISIESPMGRSILGKKSGDTFSVTERDGKIATYKILSIK